MGSVRDENFLTSSITTFARRSLLHAISFLIRPMHATFPAYVLPLHWPHVRSRKKRATRHAFSPSPCYVLSFRPKYTVHTPLSAHSHTARSSTWTRDQISPPPPPRKNTYTTQHKYIHAGYRNVCDKEHRVTLVLINHAKKTNGQREVQLQAFLTPALDAAEWSALSSGRFSHEAISAGTRWNEGWVGPEQVWKLRSQTLSQSGIEPVTRPSSWWTIRYLLSYPSLYDRITSVLVGCHLTCTFPSVFL